MVKSTRGLASPFPLVFVSMRIFITLVSLLKKRDCVVVVAGVVFFYL